MRVTLARPPGAPGHPARAGRPGGSGPSAAATSSATAAAVASGRRAAVTPRPSTRRSAPAAAASPGLATRAWSSAGDPAGRTPGQRMTASGCAASGPRRVQRRADQAGAARRDGHGDPLVEDVGPAVADRSSARSRPSVTGGGWPAVAAPCSKPSTAARTITIAAGGVGRQVPGAGRPDDGGGPAHGGRDVVQLEVGEHVEALAPDRARWRRGRRRVNSCSPTLATPNHGRSPRTSARASSSESTSRARTRWSRAGCGSTSRSPPRCAAPTSLGRPRRRPGPPPTRSQLRQHPGRRPGVGEGRRAHLDRLRAGQQQLGRVATRGHATDADDGQVGLRGRARRRPPARPRAGWPGRTARPRRRPSTGRPVDGSSTMPSRVLTSVTASAPPSRAAAAISGSSGGRRAELGPPRPPATRGGLHRRPGGRRASGRTCAGGPPGWGRRGSPRPPRPSARGEGQQVGRGPVLLDRAAPDAGHDPGPGPQQRRQVVLAARPRRRDPGAPRR